MVISLSEETQRLLQERIANGNYASADQVVHAALNALDALEASGLDDSALEAIDEAESQIERGDVRNWSDVREQVRAKFLGL